MSCVDQNPLIQADHKPTAERERHHSRLKCLRQLRSPNSFRQLANRRMQSHLLESKARATKTFSPEVFLKRDRENH